MLSEHPSPMSSFISGGEYQGIPWTLFLSDRLPELRLITASVCLVLHEEHIGLVRHAHRGWELPGGHREWGEHPDVTARREVKEEFGSEVVTLWPLAYQEFTYAVPYKDYPFPRATIAYYSATVQSAEPGSVMSCSQIVEARFFSFEVAIRLLTLEFQRQLVMVVVSKNRGGGTI